MAWKVLVPGAILEEDLARAGVTVDDSDGGDRNPA